MARIEIITGSEAAAIAAALARPDVVPAYPITPQTGIIETLSQLIAKGELKNCEFMAVESEHTALAAAVGASQQGARVFTATSSQGLLLMHEITHWASGARLPIVMVNVNRAIGPPWNIWSDETDSLSQRDTGWIQIHCENNQEVFDMTLAAFKIAEHTCLPVMVCMDGFLLSHTKENVTLATQEQADVYLPKTKIPHALSCDDPRSVGASGNPEYYFRLKKALARDIGHSPSCVKAAFKKFKKIFGTEYSLVEKYRMEEADIALVTMGSITTIARTSVDMLREKGIKAGIVKLRLFRPLPLAEIKKAVGGAKKIVVLDVNTREIVLDEIKKAVYPKDTPVFGYTVGVGGVETSPEFLASLVEEVNVLDQPKETGSIWRTEKEIVLQIPGSPSTEQPSGSAGLIQPGHRACAGCTASLVMRHVLDAMGPNTEIAMPACCWSIIAGPNPYTPLKVPLMHCAFETAAATASGIKRASIRDGKDINVIAFAGDGGTFDIGLQALSGAAERGEDIIYICYDNEAYMNTGGQRSSSTPFGAVTETTPYPNFKTQQKKNIMKIMAAHGVAYAATASIYHLDDLKKKLQKAKDARGKGLRFLQILAPCNPGWKIAPDQSLRMAFLAIETKTFPLIEYENGKWRITYRPEKKIDLKDYLKVQGRFSKLTQKEIDAIQISINNYWEELEKLEKYF
jgi:pyruvate/2-oxoacid:ferredoxin oxidoreductase alpha subunit/pyruvate/2-oxoacid:ferredoxin oxidoreductase beta subunit